MIFKRSRALFEEARKYIPGGVNSPVRAFKSVGGTPIFIKSAKGAYLTDEDGNKYIDYINSWGPMILGHNHTEVVEAVRKQMQNGFSFGTPTELETEIAKLITSFVPNIDKIRMVNSGTEACMSAIRLARGYTSRNKIIKFEGCYHGHSDSFLIKAGSGAATFGNPNSPGVTNGTAKDTLLARYNDIDSVQSLFENNKNEIAAVILEPIAGNMGCVPPKKDFLKQLKLLCKDNQSLLIFDEVMTGFRAKLGGAQDFFNVQADIVTYGKIIGGGMPVGAFAARKEIMDFLSPEGKVYQAGTLSGNPIAMCAGYTTLSILKSDLDIYDRITQTTKILSTELKAIFESAGIQICINQCTSMLTLFFGISEVSNFDDASKADHDMFNKYFHFLLENGIYLPPSGYETWFISDCIKEDEIDKTLTISKKFISSI
ncbi:glutamate-1-semialdehyde 2,1-aminomutase [Apibacter sp.]|uniref:glutamate-1-semialdehyde 2,1-aminomutase n=1 Tax=Apibacter sp. TaxID=2023709 RepID=UPI0025FA9606|nr:glutamate-1-semialdehyde 2,1-aminomutase [Apibacter sp.]MCT6868615.1 glutamate-1-semialdehyde 2,1-aminomutase [Apibacter sp.]